MYGWPGIYWSFCHHIRNLLGEKLHVNRRFNIDSFQMFAVLRGFQALTVLAITLALVCFIEAVPNNVRDKE